MLSVICWCITAGYICFLLCAAFCVFCLTACFINLHLSVLEPLQLYHPNVFSFDLSWLRACLRNSAVNATFDWQVHQPIEEQTRTTTTTKTTMATKKLQKLIWKMDWVNEGSGTRWSKKANKGRNIPLKVLQAHEHVFIYVSRSWIYVIPQNCTDQKYKGRPKAYTGYHDTQRVCVCGYAEEQRRRKRDAEL